MKMKESIKSGFYRLTKKANRIFKISYEDMSTHIYYDMKDTYRLQILRNEDNLLEREITRAEAFRIMNTRR